MQQDKLEHAKQQNDMNKNPYRSYHEQEEKQQLQGDKMIRARRQNDMSKDTK